jgi:hypothetical protein
METAMSQALAAAIPVAHDDVSLARQIVSAEQIAAMPTDELERLHVAHEAECVSLTGRLETYSNDAPRWARSAKQALRVLHLHRGWIARELARRKKAAAKAEHRQELQSVAEARKAAQREMAERQREAAEERMKRIQASNDVNLHHIAIFKEVAREVLGAEMYAHLWELTRQRIGQPA